MNKHPEDFDAGIFVGRTLEMICFNANQVYFHFDSRICIQAETSFTFEKPPAVAEITIPVMQSDLMHLLEHQILKASAADQHILTLEFDDGSRLRFSDTAPGKYESYHVFIGDRRIIV
jgi:hypothetical protein